MNNTVLFEDDLFCKCCDSMKVFGSEDELALHETQAHPYLPGAQAKKEEDGPPGSVRCHHDGCGKWKPNRQAFRNHQASKHPGPFYATCPKAGCGRSYGSKADYETHVCH